MSLNSEQMLPARVRKMRQMEDLLNVEDIILAEIERIIDEMYGAAALLHEELVNEAWLKEKLDARTGADTTVEADADKLLATITLDVSKIVGVERHPGIFGQMAASTFKISCDFTDREWLY